MKRRVRAVGLGALCLTWAALGISIVVIGLGGATERAAAATTLYLDKGNPSCS